MFYLSGYFESHRDQYYAGLQSISRDGDWEGWISYFLNAVVEQSRENIRKARDIHALYDAKKERIRSITHSQYSVQALDFLFSFPVFNSADFVKNSGIPRATALRILKLLATKGVIEEVRKGTRGKPSIFIFPKLLAIVK